MSIAGALHSDHVNYLVLRYLQESGHENSARAFYRDWHRPRDYRDPEDLPFAPAVSRHELISVVQSALNYDELQARVGRNARRYRWTDLNARESVEQGDGVSPPEADSRPGSAPEKRKSVVAGSVGVMRAPDDFPTPAPKRQRISNGPEGVHINGDAMDVDAQSASAAEVDDNADQPSPAVASEDAVDVPAERYDSLDVATQTDVRVGPKTSTLLLNLSKRGSRIHHSSFSPDSSDLLAVGENLCRYYRVPDDFDDDINSVQHTDEPSIPQNGVVTAMAWHPEGHTATCAIDSIRTFSGEKSVPAQMLMDIGRDFGSTVYPPGLPLLEPPGIVLCLRYSPNGDFILVLRTNLKRGLLQVWETRPKAEKPYLRTEPIAWRIFEHPVLDAAWSGSEKFVVCGERGVQSELHLQGQRELANTFTPETVAKFNLVENSIRAQSQEITLDKIRSDAKQDFAICASTTKGILMVSSTLNDGQKDFAEIEIPQGLTGLALQPRDDASSEATDSKISLVAATFESGLCILYSISRTESQRLTIEVHQRLECAEGPALALSWSPKGDHLAVASMDMAFVWRAGPDLSFDRRPWVSWPPATDRALLNNKTLEANGEDATVSEPSLSWDKNGERLSFAVEGRIAIIAFRPPLHEPEGMNGQPTP